MVGRASIADVGPTSGLDDILHRLYDVTRNADAERVEQTQHGGDGDQTTRYNCDINLEVTVLQGVNILFSLHCALQIWTEHNM